MQKLDQIGAARAVVITSLLLVLAACGGGGSSGGGSESAVATVHSSTFATSRNTPGIGYFAATVPAGRQVEYRIVTNGSLGTAVVLDHDKGEFRYAPNPNVTGSDFFTFRLVDGAGESGLAVVSVTITPPPGPNTPPVAANDAFIVAEDSTTLLAVLSDNGSGADIDPDEDTPVISAVGTPNNGGSATIDVGGDMLIYTPRPNFVGDERIGYTISDGRGGSSSAVVTVTVTAVNDMPVAANDTVSVLLNSSNNPLLVLADNGSGPDFDVDNDQLTISAIGTPNKGGSASINVTKDGLFYTPATNFAGTESFAYTVTDGHGLSSTATVTAHVTFADDFSGGMSNWTVINDNGAVSSWTVTGGMLRQQNAVSGLAQSYQKGAYAYFAPGTSLTDYRFSVEALFLGTRLANDIGIMFRYQNNNNYYRLSMNSRYGFTRLEKKVGGAFSTLAVNPRGYAAGQLLNFSVDVNGSSIQILINGDPVFAVNDTSLTSGSVALYTQDKASFDNVRIEGPATSPAVTLATPVAHTVGTGNTIVATAVATNIPAGGAIEFTLDNTDSIVDTTYPYTATFTGVSQGNHSLAAIVRDTANIELVRDTNINVGAAGTYLIAIGDSIINGSGDNYALDNQSDRIYGFQGIAAGLAGLLESSQARPVVVYNEGIGGDKSVDALSRVDSILSRHPGSHTAIVMLGTNDALAQTPSGSGCTGANCSGTFKGNMQSLIATLAGAGKTVYIARIPPVFGSSQSNSPYADPTTGFLNTDFVDAYNAIVTSQLSGHQLGPDFYAYFLGNGQNRFSLFADIWHPNALGHTVMAALWHNAINPTSTTPLPFVLDNLSPSTVAPYVKQNLLEAGDAYYVDADYTLVSIPTELQNARWVMTANADFGNASANHVSFNVDRAVTVYVAFDAGAAARPAWMTANGFVATNLTISVTDPLSPTLTLYKKKYNAGNITLGGNLAAGASGANSNYVVAVIPD